MRKLLFLISAFILTALIFPVSTFAQETVSQNFSLEKGKIITHNPYFAYGENVKVSGIVNGDTYVAGGDVVIDGNINGDLLVTGGRVEISGSVKEDVRVVGGEVVLKGKVGKNFSFAGGKITVDPLATISGSFVGVFGELQMLGTISGNVDIAGGRVVTNGKSLKDFDVVAGQIELGEKAFVGGKLEYWSDVKPVLTPTTIIKGQTIEHAFPMHMDKEKDYAKKFAAVAGSLAVASKLICFLSLIVIGLIFIKISRKFMDKTAEITSQSFWKSLGVGFLVLVATPLVFVILLATIIGIPLGFILITIYGVLLYIAKIFAVYALGQKILPNKSPYLGYLIAVVAYSLIMLIPVVGGLTSFVALLVGIGAFVAAKKDLLAKYNK